MLGHPPQISNLEDHSLSAVRNCFSSQRIIFSVSASFESKAVIRANLTHFTTGAPRIFLGGGGGQGLTPRKCIIYVWFYKLCYEYHVKIFEPTSSYVTGKIKTNWKRKNIHIFLMSLLYFWIFHCTSYEPILVVDFGWSINHAQTLIAPHLQNLRFFFF